MNQLIIAGKVVRSPRYSASGKSPVLSFTVLSTRTWREKTFSTYCEVVAFGDKATQLNGSVKEGDYCICQGEAGAEHYESKGEHRGKLKCNAQSVDVVGVHGSVPVSRPMPVVHPDTKAPPETDDSGDLVPF